MCVLMELPMPTMNVSLPAELIAFVEDEVTAGEYGTASEVVRDGLRRLLPEKATGQERAAILRREVNRGLREARGGRVLRPYCSDVVRPGLECAVPNALVT